MNDPKLPDRPSLPFDKRVHFIPEANLIIVLPHPGQQLILFRFDAEARAAKAGVQKL